MALSRQHIARAGLGLLNEVGLGNLTLRLIARELGVQAPALYWHVRNKQELLDEMAAQMLRDAIRSLPEPDGDWERWLCEVARAVRGALLDHRDGIRVYCAACVTGPDLFDPRLFQPLLDAGFEQREVGRAWSALYAFVIGFAVEERTARPVTAPGDAGERFTDGLAVVLDGIRSRLLAN
jgi:AcrR family transcriptional regulator